MLQTVATDEMRGGCRGVHVVVAGGAGADLWHGSVGALVVSAATMPVASP
jgi:hypothetical protein